jgi:multiple sugar transport system permease protein
VPKRSWQGVAGIGLLGLIGLATVAPFLYMVSVSFMGEAELSRWPPPLVPTSPGTSNYVVALEGLPYARVFLNTAIVASCVMLGQVLTSAAAGYAFARMKFAGRDGIFAMVVVLLAIPAFLLLIPRYLLISTLGWVDTYPGLISTELVSVWGILLMRQSFLMLPRDVEDAARLDGAGEWTLFWRVTLPLARPSVAALAVLAFMDQWRNFLWPLVVTRSREMYVAEVALADFHTTYAGNWPYQMAAAVLVTLPVLVICLLAQRSVLHGVRTTGPRVRL